MVCSFKKLIFSFISKLEDTKDEYHNNTQIWFQKQTSLQTKYQDKIQEYRKCQLLFYYRPRQKKNILNSSTHQNEAEYMAAPHKVPQKEKIII